MGGCASSAGGGSGGGGGGGRRGAGTASPWNGSLHDARPWSTLPSVSAAQLGRLRDEFWGSRVQGNSEMWAAMRTAADSARDGRDGRALAAEFLKAAGLVPADLKRPCLNKCYDESGVLYVVPCYALRDPENLDQEPVCTEFKDAAAVVQDLDDGSEAATP